MDRHLRDTVLARDRHRCVACGHPATDVHHRLPRARGGRLLDAAGETWHLAACCHRCHMAAHDTAAGRAGPLFVGGYVTSRLDGRPVYVGDDPTLTARYGQDRP